MKLKEFQNELKKRKIDCCILANLKNKDENVFYFLQEEVEYCFLLIPKNKKPRLFMPSFEESKARIRTATIKDFTKMAFLKKHLKGAKRIGINKSSLTLNAYRQLRKIKKAKYADVSPIIYRLRATKTKKEIKNIRDACRITDRVMQECIKKIKSFKTEKEVEAFIKKQGEVSFIPIVASGKNSAKPHNKNTGRLGKGFCMIDLGIKNKGYCADMTRTIYIGKPSKKEKEFYNLLLDTQKVIIKNLKAGTTIKGIDSLIKKKLKKHYKNVLHAFGHSLGIEVHDPYDHKGRFSANTVFTVEPGIYFKNRFGIRIEDDVLITKNGCKALTKTPKKLITK